MNPLDQYPTPLTDALCKSLEPLLESMTVENAQELLTKIARDTLGHAARMERERALCREALTRVRGVALAAHDDWDESVTKRAAIKQDIEAIVNLANQTLEATEPNL